MVFLKVYSEGNDDEDGEDENEGMLPPLVAGQQPELQEMMANEKFTRPQPHVIQEASLVKKTGRIRHWPAHLLMRLLSALYNKEAM